MVSVQQVKSTRIAHRLKDRLARFRRAEDGAMIVMTITWLMLMLVVGGMAVDFMRFESRRALLQSTADRAVLAAADLTQDKDRANVVVDYFEKAGFGDTIVGEVSVIDEGNYNSVGVVAKLPMNTVFLRWLGIDELKAPAAATAVEGIANVEVSLVLDISGSMADPVTPANGGSSNESKISALRKAAVKFAEVMLTDEYKDKISISLIPYSQQVNAGPLLLNEMQVNKMHNFSHCLDLTDAQLTSVAMDTGVTYQQEQHYQWNPGSYSSYTGYANEITEPICPFYDYERITPVSQNLGQLRTQINKLQPRGGTAIYYGLKWAVALLDPSMNGVISTLADDGEVDDIFAVRPEAYPVEGEANPSQKVVVLMTDGQNSNSDRIAPDYYKNADDVAHWAEYNLWYSATNHFGVTRQSQLLGFLTYRRFHSNTDYGGSDGDALLASLCTKAKAKDIIIYGIAVEAGSHGATQMANCASSAAHFFDVTGDQMESTFEGIARQITELRLSL